MKFSLLACRSLAPVRSRFALGGLTLFLFVLLQAGLSAVTLPVQTGLQLWLAADQVNPADPTQVTTVNGTAYVKAWRDASPNHFDATQATQSKQPTLVAGVLNNLPVLLFDGISSAFTTSLPQIAGNKSIFIVHGRITLPASGCGTEISTTSTSSGFFLGNSGGYETAGRYNVAHDLFLPAQFNAYVLKSFIRNGGTSTLMVDDQTQPSIYVGDVATGNYTISDVNGTFAYSGSIAEVLVYNRAVSEAERQAIENYLSEKWGLWMVPLQVQNGLQLWVAGDSLNYHNPTEATFYNNNYLVRKWQCRGGAPAISPTQPTGSHMPICIVNGLNGRPTLRFDGYTSYMNTNLAQIAGDKSILMVEKRTKSDVGCEISSNSPAGGMFLGSNTGWPTTGPITEGKGRFGIGWDQQVPALPNQFAVKSFIRGGKVEKLQVNDAVATTSGTPDAAHGLYTISDSTSFLFGGELAELLIYNRALTAPETIQVQNYLQDKWSYSPFNLFATTPDQAPAPAMTSGTPAPGVRVKQTSPEYAGTNAYHTLYLPRDWQPGKTYPVIIDYAGNGPFSDQYGDVSTGNVEDLSLGYGITGGTGFIWVCMPTIGGTPLTNQQVWWGDVNATKDYCLKTVRHVCEDWGGDPSQVIISGFSRGSIACNYIGLNDDTMADIWLAFIPHSYYDGQVQWGYPGDDAASALIRALRLKGRAQHVTHEAYVSDEEPYLRGMGIDLTNISIRTLPFANHTDLWPFRPIQLRRDTRAWLAQVLATRPGTHKLTGKVTRSDGTPVAGARIQSGYTHFTYSAADGTYTLASLIDSSRTVSVTASGLTFTDQAVTVSGANVPNVNFTAN